MIVSQILEEKEKVIAGRKVELPLEDLKKVLGESFVSKEDFKKSISANAINLIAEIKAKSPSRGTIRKEFNPVRIALDYAFAGAKALSVLTEEKFFGGSIVFIKEIKKDINLPILQKDFIIDEYQVYEAKFYGADAILLIADLLTEKEMAHFRDIAEKRLDMGVLCEVHTEEDLDKVLNIGAQLIGINNRNLHDFKVDLETTQRLIRRIPSGKVIVSESGIKTHNDVMYLKSLGVNAVLIGEAFMEAKDIVAKVREVMGTHVTKQ